MNTFFHLRGLIDYNIENYCIVNIDRQQLNRSDDQAVLGCFHEICSIRNKNKHLKQFFSLVLKA